MSAPICERIGLAALSDYAARDLPDAEAAAIEEHLFSCPACAERAAEFDTLVHAIPPAVRSADVAGFVTDAVLNQLSREGVRMRTFALSPDAIVPCAVWEHDEVMVLRLRADFGGAAEVTLSQRVGGREMIRATSQVAAAQGEIIYAQPAALVRLLPVVEVDLVLTAHEHGAERPIATYTLRHGGSLHRS